MDVRIKYQTTSKFSNLHFLFLLLLFLLEQNTIVIYHKFINCDFIATSILEEGKKVQKLLPYDSFTGNLKWGYIGVYLQVSNPSSPSLFYFLFFFLQHKWNYFHLKKFLPKKKKKKKSEMLPCTQTSHCGWNDTLQTSCKIEK